MSERIIIKVMYINEKTDERFEASTTFDKVPDQQRVVVRASDLIANLYNHVR